MKTTNTRKSVLGLMTSLGAVLAFCVVATAALPARAEDNNGKQGTWSDSDYKFIKSALKGGTMEVTLGQIAEQHGSDQSVRDFGQRMVKDHSKANDELTKLAQQKGAMIPDMVDKNKRHAEHLSKMSGSDFDRAYIKQMVSDHKKDVKEFQREETNANDSDLRSWVKATLPTLQDHLRQAQAIEASLKSQTALK